MFATTALWGVVGLTPVQAQTKPAPDGAAEIEEVVVVGSQIQGAKVNAALPVTVVNEEQIQATAAVSGDELFRTIPQAGNVNFNSSFIPNSWTNQLSSSRVMKVQRHAICFLKQCASFYSRGSMKAVMNELCAPRTLIRCLHWRRGRTPTE